MMLAYSPGPTPRRRNDDEEWPLGFRAFLGVCIVIFCIFTSPVIIIAYIRYLVWVWTTVFAR